MKLKTLGLAISLASAGWLSVSETASAAKFIENDTLAIYVPSFQINAATSLKTGEHAGGADGFADALFGTGNPKVSMNDRVINKNGQDVKPGMTGDFAVASSSGNFNDYFGKTGEITSFDGFQFSDLTEVNGGFNPFATPDAVPSSKFNDNFLMRLDKGTGNDLYFYLTEVALEHSVSQILAGKPIVFQAKGWLAATNDDSDLEYYQVEYAFTSQSLSDNGRMSSDPMAEDGVTGVTTLSGTSMVVKIVTSSDPQPVPEPSTIIGLTAVASAGLLMKKKRV